MATSSSITKMKTRSLPVRCCSDSFRVSVLRFMMLSRKTALQFYGLRGCKGMESAARNRGPDQSRRPEAKVKGLRKQRAASGSGVS